MTHNSSGSAGEGGGKGERGHAAGLPATGAPPVSPAGKGAGGAAATLAAAAGKAAAPAAAQADATAAAGPGTSNFTEEEDAAEPALLKRQQLLQRLEVQQRASNLVAAVPTNDKAVRRILRLAGQPITFFGEGPFERRERLRLLFAEGRVSVSAEVLQRVALEEETAAAAGAAAALATSAAASAAPGKPAGAAAGDVGGAAAAGESEDQDTFFTEGVPELKEARRLIFEDSVRRARTRVLREKLLKRDVPRGNSAAAVSPLQQQQQQGQHGDVSAAAAATDGVADGRKGPNSKNNKSSSSSKSVDATSASVRGGGGGAAGGGEAGGAGAAAAHAADARRVGAVVLPRDSVLLRVLELERMLEQQLAASSSQIGDDRPLTSCKFSPGVPAAALWGAAAADALLAGSLKSAKRPRVDGRGDGEKQEAAAAADVRSNGSSCSSRGEQPLPVKQQPAQQQRQKEGGDDDYYGDAEAGEGAPAAAAKRFWDEAACTDYFSQYLATGSWNDVVRIWTVADGALLHELHGHSSRVHALAWRTAAPHNHLEAPVDSTDTEKGGIPLLLASAGGDARICMWDIHRLSGDSSGSSNSVGGSSSSNHGSLGKRGAKHSKALVYTLQGHEDRVNRLLFHPSGRFLFSTSHDETWRMWDVETQQELLLQEGHAAAVYGLAVHADGSLLVTSDISGAVWVWDLRSGRAVLPLAAHVKQVVGVSVHPIIGNWLATAADDHAVKIWDLRKAARTALFSSPPPAGTRSMKKAMDASVEHSAAAADAPASAPNHAAAAAAGGGLAAASGSAATSNSEAPSSASSSSAAASAAAASSAAASSPSLGGGGAAAAASGAPAAAPSAGEDPAGAADTARPAGGAAAGAAAALQHQQHAASGALQQQLRSSGKFLLTTVLAHHKLVADVMFEPVLGRCMYTAGFDGLVKVWNIHDFSCIKTLAGHEGRVMALDVMRGGKAVVSAGFDRTWKLWRC